MLVELVQNKPVVVVQSEVPHEQGAELIEAPSVVEHGAALLQELMDAVQNIPVVEVQYLAPHLQSTPAVLVVAPSVFAHIGDVQHSLPLSVQKVQTVAASLAGCTEDEQVTAPPAVLFLPQLPHVESDEQVPEYMLVPG